MLDEPGKAAKLNARVERALARADVEEAERLKVLTSMELEHPLVRFVVAEGENAYAAALDMAPETGTATLNGLQLEGKTARAAAKMIRHAVKAKARGPRKLFLPPRLKCASPWRAPRAAARKRRAQIQLA